YRLLEIVRQFAHERLEEAGETQEYERRHLHHFIDVAETAEPLLRSLEQLRWHQRLKAEIGNFLSALRRNVQDGGGLTAEGRHLAAALGYWWPVFSGRFHEARFWLEAAAGEGSEPVDESAARASLWCSWMAYDRNDFDEAERRSRLALSGLPKPSWHAAFASFMNAFAPALPREDVAEVERVLKEGRTWFAEAGEAEWGDALMSLGQSDIARITGRLDGAEEANHHALAVARRIGDELLQAFALVNLGHLILDREDAEEAAPYFEEAIAIARRLDNLWVLGYCLAGLGRLAVARKEWRRGARVLSAATGFYDRIGARLQIQDQKSFDVAAAAARRALGEKAFEREWQVGWNMSLPEAIRTALGGNGRSSGLTKRQMEVALLVANGLSNREIAEQLVISEHTAARHVEHILARLRLSSRVQIATWMLRRD
ncbi:MAG TPA: LuxR C-terminal-related transcriptional regulator, partial [Actinomycetota bacterium]|nr:LuxR C-terminal-related transcriptional regulator [Actinomycetota bacterium]